MVRRAATGSIIDGIIVGRGIPSASVDGLTVGGGGVSLCAPKDRVQRGLAAQDGATDGFRDLRHHRVAEGLDDQARRRRPLATAERNARASQPGGNPIIHP